MIAAILLSLAGLYLLCGFIFAIPFVLVGGGKIDPHAARGSWGFRILILPGTTLLWSLLAKRWIRGGYEPPEEKNAHRLKAERSRRREEADLKEAPTDRDWERSRRREEAEPAPNRLVTSAATNEGFIDVCAVEEIPEKRARIVCLSGVRVAVFKYNGKVSAVSNVCQHQNGPLGEGKIVDGCITWPVARLSIPAGNRRLSAALCRGCYEFRCNELEICKLHSKFVIHGLWADR